MDSDRLYPLSHSQELADALSGCACVDLLYSDVGHDGFLVESQLSMGWSQSCWSASTRVWAGRQPGHATHRVTPERPNLQLPIAFALRSGSHFGNGQAIARWLLRTGWRNPRPEWAWCTDVKRPPRDSWKDRSSPFRRRSRDDCTHLIAMNVAPAKLCERAIYRLRATTNRLVGRIFCATVVAW